MKLRTTWHILARDISMGPRTMMVLWLVGFPLLITFLIRMVFGDLIDPAPRLGIVDLGSSIIPIELQADTGLDVTVLDNESGLRSLVRSNDLDAGLVLQPGFDDAVRDGDQPVLQLFMSGESLASNRVVLAITAMDAVRGVAGEPAPVTVATEVIGPGSTVPIEQRLVPILILLAVALAGIFLPAAGIIQEKTTRTIEAVLLTPARVGDVFVAKGVLGFLLSTGAGTITLLINGGFSGYVGGNLLAIAVGALMSVQIGLMMGATIKDIQTMFTVWKSGALILFAPAILFLFPGVPQWIARVFPTYYFLGPLYRMTIDAVPLRDVAVDLAIGVAISVVLAFIAGRTGARMEQRLAAQ